MTSAAIATKPEDEPRPLDVAQALALAHHRGRDRHRHDPQRARELRRRGDGERDGAVFAPAPTTATCRGSRAPPTGRTRSATGPARGRYGGKMSRPTALSTNTTASATDISCAFGLIDRCDRGDRAAAADRGADRDHQRRVARDLEQLAEREPEHDRRASSDGRGDQRAVEAGAQHDDRGACRRRARSTPSCSVQVDAALQLLRRVAPPRERDTSRRGARASSARRTRRARRPRQQRWPSTPSTRRGGYHEVHAAVGVGRGAQGEAERRGKRPCEREADPAVDAGRRAGSRRRATSGRRSSRGARAGSPGRCRRRRAARPWAPRSRPSRRSRCTPQRSTGDCRPRRAASRDRSWRRCRRGPCCAARVPRAAAALACGLQHSSTSVRSGTGARLTSTWPASTRASIRRFSTSAHICDRQSRAPARGRPARAPSRDLEQRAQPGERRAQLVADIGGELALARERGLEPREQLVERAHRRRELARLALDRQPRREPALRRSSRGRGAAHRAARARARAATRSPPPTSSSARPPSSRNRVRTVAAAASTSSVPSATTSRTSTCGRGCSSRG